MRENGGEGGRGAGREGRVKRATEGEGTWRGYVHRFVSEVVTAFTPCPLCRSFPRLSPSSPFSPPPDSPSLYHSSPHWPLSDFRLSFCVPGKTRRSLHFYSRPYPNLRTPFRPHAYTPTRTGGRRIGWGVARCRGGGVGCAYPNRWRRRGGAVGVGVIVACESVRGFRGSGKEGKMGQTQS